MDDEYNPSLKYQRTGASKPSYYPRQEPQHISYRRLGSKDAINGFTNGCSEPESSKRNIPCQECTFCRVQKARIEELEKKTHQLERTNAMLKSENQELKSQQAAVQGSHCCESRSNAIEEAHSANEDDTETDDDMDEDYDPHTIPDDLLKYLKQVCTDHGISNEYYLQDPNNCHQIMIFGENVESLDQETINRTVAVKSSWGGYSISLKNNQDGKGFGFTELYSARIQKLPLGVTESEGTCELLAEHDEDDGGMRNVITVAVAPAHLLLSGEQIQQVEDGQNFDDVENVRLDDESLCRLQFTNDDDIQEISYTQHPPKIVCRHNVPIDYRADDPLYQLCRNDTVCLELDKNRAQRLHQQFSQQQPLRRKRVIAMEKWSKIKKYVWPDPKKEIPVVINGLTGKLVRHIFPATETPTRPADGKGLCLTFQLTNGNLHPGDSGCILFEEKGDGKPGEKKRRPLGMFIGEWKNNPFGNQGHYHAVFLSEVLKEISDRYNIINGIHLYGTRDMCACDNRTGAHPPRCSQRQ